MVTIFVEVNIYLTYDYELFFGNDPGTVGNCLLRPTNAIMDCAHEFGAKMTFFVDIGYIIKLNEYAQSDLSLKSDLDLVLAQIQDMVDRGHSVQLHIHPHWERSVHRDGQWQIVVDGAYKLSDFSDEEIRSIVTRYKKELEAITGVPATVFRAGGWCVQPFERLREVFSDLGIQIDSSVFPGGQFISPHYDFDFRNAPRKDKYAFSKDVCVEDPQGEFTEYPISSRYYSPLFYWKLYVLGRLFPKKHKMWGDGLFLAQPGRKCSVLTSFTWNHVSTDGYYASMLDSSLKNFQAKGFREMVVIGHPKGLTDYSLHKLNRFLSENHQKHQFISLKTTK